MCKAISLDKQQTEALKQCIADSQKENRSLLAKTYTAVTMLLIGMHASGHRSDFKFDENKPLF
ncbi:MAG: hypothetical protein R3332_12680 [Pseudohongiellaceae bacterium]|nr:hypothetical protein [Pseudohongiellaceae bacterium]